MGIRRCLPDTVRRKRRWKVGESMEERMGGEEGERGQGERNVGREDRGRRHDRVGTGDGETGEG